MDANANNAPENLESIIEETLHIQETLQRRKNQFSEAKHRRRQHKNRDSSHSERPEGSSDAHVLQELGDIKNGGDDDIHGHEHDNDEDEDGRRPTPHAPSHGRLASSAALPSPRHHAPVPHNSGGLGHIITATAFISYTLLGGLVDVGATIGTLATLAIRRRQWIRRLIYLLLVITLGAKIFFFIWAPIALGISRTCTLPYLTSTEFCQTFTTTWPPKQTIPPVYENITTSGEIWQQLLEKKIEMAPMPERVLHAANTMRDVNAIVFHSTIPSKKALGEACISFIVKSEATARSLHRFFTTIDWVTNYILISQPTTLLNNLDLIRQDPRYDLRWSVRDVVFEWLCVSESRRIRVANSYIHFLQAARFRCEQSLAAAEEVLKNFDELERILHDIDQMRRLDNMALSSSKHSLQGGPVYAVLGWVGYNGAELKQLKEDQMSLATVADYRHAVTVHILAMKSLMLAYDESLAWTREHINRWLGGGGVSSMLTAEQPSQVELNEHFAMLQKAVAEFAVAVQKHNTKFAKELERATATVTTTISVG